MTRYCIGGRPTTVITKVYKIFAFCWHVFLVILVSIYTGLLRGPLPGKGRGPGPAQFGIRDWAGLKGHIDDRNLALLNGFRGQKRLAPGEVRSGPDRAG